MYKRQGYNGGDSSSVSSSLTSGVTQIFSTAYAFAALKNNGSVITWGAYVGEDVGEAVGEAVGEDVGESVGEDVGEAVIHSGIISNLYTPISP